VPHSLSDLFSIDTAERRTLREREGLVNPLLKPLANLRYTL